MNRTFLLRYQAYKKGPMEEPKELSLPFASLPGITQTYKGSSRLGRMLSPARPLHNLYSSNMTPFFQIKRCHIERRATTSGSESSQENEMWGLDHAEVIYAIVGLTIEYGVRRVVLKVFSSGRSTVVFLKNWIQRCFCET